MQVSRLMSIQLTLPQSVQAVCVGSLVLTAAAILGATALPISSQGHSGSNLPHGIPNFGARPTSKAVRGGAWSSPSTWSDSRLPQNGDVVTVPRGISVSYDLQSDVALRAVVVEGSLIFRTDRTTRLVSGLVQILPTGALEIGSAEAPVQPDVRAELIIADHALDVAEDPEQYGNGLIGLGRIRMHGAVVSPTFARLAKEPRVGDVMLTLTEPTSGGWEGAKLILPGTNQPRPNTESYRPEWEELTVSAHSGRDLHLVTALKFDHRGARDADGKLEFLPHVGNLTRNVVVRSANPSGTRGHVIFVHRADVDIRYALFKDLGRTTFAPLDSTVFDERHHPTRIGKNQIGRYSLHMHHLTGPASLPTGEPQFRLIGNAVDGGSKWGITIHNSHFGLVRDNIVYDVGGAGIVTEDGSESGNRIDHNFVIRAWGNGGEAGVSRAASNDWGWEGSAFWFRGPNNHVTRNVGANANSYAMAFIMKNVSKLRVPVRAGEDPTSGRYRTVDMNRQAILEFSENEVYSSFGGLTLWNLGASCCKSVFEVDESLVENFRVWHIARAGYSGYATNRVTFDGWIQRGDVRALANRHESIVGFTFGDYLARNTVIRNSDIQGLRTGIVAPLKAGDTSDIYGVLPGTLIVESTTLRNAADIVIRTQYGVTGGGSALPPRQTILRNVRFGTLNPPTLGRKQYVVMEFAPNGTNANPFISDEVIVTDYNGVRGDDFRVFYAEQAPAFVIPATAAQSSEPLTNADSWTRYHRAIGGAVSPCADRRQGIVGITCSLAQQTGSK